MRARQNVKIDAEIRSPTVAEVGEGPPPPLWHTSKSEVFAFGGHCACENTWFAEDDFLGKFWSP